MKTVRIFLALVLCFCLMSPQGSAQDLWEKANSESYKVKAGPMFVRGLLNAATSPVDILVQTVDKTKSGPPLIGTLTGMAGGLGCTALRAGSGIIDVALFWVPGFNGFPVDRSYHNCLLCAEEKPVVASPVIRQSVVTPLYSEPAPAPRPVVTVSEEPASVITPKRKIHDPYRYVKK
jgi:putative exosortase-associated protein (TIGR04073 family)